MTAINQIFSRLMAPRPSFWTGRWRLVYQGLVFGVIGFGVFLRLVQYLSGRSLWLDEACLALNIVNRSYGQLLEPLDYGQAAPIGFLVLEKLSVTLLHNNDSVLKLFPLLCGLLSLLLFHKLLKHGVSKTSGLFALALFAVSGELVYYASSLKPYICDVFVALALFLMAFRLESGKLTFSRMAVFALAGAVSVWLSYPAVFILAGLGFTLVSVHLFKRDMSRVTRLSGVCMVWAASFLVFYLVNLRQSVGHQGLQQYWADNFMPFPPSGVSDWVWILDKLVAMFYHPAQLRYGAFGAGLFLISAVSMAFWKRKVLFLLIFPILLALIASGFHKYPFYGRLLLFVIPALYYVIAMGVDRLSLNSNLIKALLMGILLYHPFLTACHHLTEPRVNEEIKPVMAFIKENWSAGDQIYVYYKTEPAFAYYADRYGFQRDDYRVGNSPKIDKNAFLKDIEKIRGNKRVWIVFTHVHPDEKKSLIKQLNQRGAQRRAFQAPGAFGFLYDLS